MTAYLLGLLGFLSNPGTLMQPPGPGTIPPSPPVETFNITTEADDPLLTEFGDNLVTESAP